MAGKRAAYTLFPRKTKKSKVYYFQTYSPDGRRTTAKSTGETSKAAARAYCDDLLKRGVLYQGASVHFSDYAGSFFDTGSSWITDRLNCGTPDRPALSDSYIVALQSILKNYLIPFFGKYKLEDIRPTVTKKFRAWMITEKKLSFKTVNSAVSVFKIICDSALADGLMMFDPLRTIHPLIANPKDRDAFTIPEICTLIQLIRDSEKTAIIIGATTGMRVSEILAIRPETIQGDFLDVRDQFYREKFSPIKTKERRKIPTVPRLHDFLLSSAKFGKYGQIEYAFNCAMKIAQFEDAKKRGLCFHSLRHFFNTYLLAENIVPHKVAAVMGHSTGVGSAQETYTNWRPEQFPEVYAAQDKLLDLLGIKGVLL